jgi:HK97 family phage portal protein
MPKLFGLNISLPWKQKASVAPTDLTPTYSAWSPLLQEGFGGAWQRNVKVRKETALTFPAVYRCVTLIASDVAKLRMRLVERTPEGIWRETTNPAYSPVLRRPNRYQNHVQFREHWMMSKLTYGNTYALKVRDNRGVVVALYVLDPRHVTVLEAPGAAVFYRLQADDLSTVNEGVTVPASEIIHDRMNAIYHPLVGVSPIAASGMAAQQGLEITRTSTKFFENSAQPSGFLTAPGQIGKDTAERLQVEWQRNFGGENVGKTAVLGDGLEYRHLTISPVDAQLIQQLNMSEKQVCTSFGVPGYKVGVSEDPKYSNAYVYNQNYYTDCLQTHINSFEVTISEGLGLPTDRYCVDIVEDDMLKMDKQTQITILREAVAAKILTPNEARAELGREGKGGGDSLWGQQQDHSLEHLQWRDEQIEMAPAAPAEPPALPPPAPEPETDEDDDEDDGEEQARQLVYMLRKAMINESRSARASL